MTFFQRFEELSRINNTSPNAVAKELGISSGSVTAWKNGTSPSVDKVVPIAKYFNISIDYLLGQSDEYKAPADDRERTAGDEELLKLYWSAPPELQAAAMAVLESAEAARLARDADGKGK